MATAKLCWIQGSRTVPFTGQRYITPARFEQEADKWPHEAWSLVLDFAEPSNGSDCVTADVHFLAPEAPEYLLTTGSKFELYEGSKRVATGEVVAGRREARKSLSA